MDNNNDNYEELRKIHPEQDRFQIQTEKESIFSFVFLFSANH